MQTYLDIVREILTKGHRKSNRTGVDTIVIDGAIFKHDMQEGFPLLTTKKMATKSIRVELEGFIKGITDKNWYQERGCHIWDEWGNPQTAPYGHDEESRARMKAERDLGPIYGWQWRHFGAEYKGHDANYYGEGVDQLANVVHTLKTNPLDRRMIVSAWNPNDLGKMALPPCHYSFQVTSDGEKLNLFWNQRSIDTMLGLPFNIASYGFLLHLLSKESKMKEGNLVGFLADTQIYVNQEDGAWEQVRRSPLELPTIETPEFTSIFNWTHDQTKINNYQSHPKIEFPLAI
ncbi:thymidylate synthase [Candidatus Pacearchaeota archaeon]|nr:thymidylate synthase [Candidatus Pacearchaeota archaeon]